LRVVVVENQRHTHLTVTVDDGRYICIFNLFTYSYKLYIVTYMIVNNIHDNIIYSFRYWLMKIYI